MLRENRDRTIALWRRLAALGFIDGLDVLARHGLDTVEQALQTLERPGVARNLGGLLRAYLAQLLITGAPPPERDRYISGRYGHLVQR